MTLESPSSIPGARRVARVAAAAGLVAALAATGAGPVFAVTGADTPGTTPAVKSADQKLGSADAELLQEAKAKGDANVTVMVATAPARPSRWPTSSTPYRAPRWAGRTTTSVTCAPPCPPARRRPR